MLKISLKSKLNTFIGVFFSLTSFLGINTVFSADDGLDHPTKKQKVISNGKAPSNESVIEDSTAIFDWRDMGEIQQDHRSWDERAEEMAQSWGMSTEEYLKKADEYISFLKKNRRETSGRTGLILLKRPNIEKVNELFEKRYNKTFTERDFPMFKLKG